MTCLSDPPHPHAPPALFSAVGGKVPDDFPVIVTSYEIVIADAKFLQTKYKFK